MNDHSDDHSDDHRDDRTEPAPDGALSRRRVMRAIAGTAAVGAATGGGGVATAGPAAAAAGSALIIGANNDAGPGVQAITSLTSVVSPSSSTFAAINNATDRPIGLYGVAGPSSGLTVSAAGVVGNSQAQQGVSGFSRDNNGVLGQSQNGVGVKATSSAYYGLIASSSNYAAVYAFAGTGQGVLGYSGSAAGVQGYSGSAGVGGQFQGGRAQVYLVPASTAGAPTSGAHSMGELFLDSGGALYLCKATGTPGTWKLIG